MIEMSEKKEELLNKQEIRRKAGSVSVIQKDI